MEDLLCERHFAISAQTGLVAREHDLILGSLVLSAVGVIPFTGNDFGLSVLVQVVPSQGMQLADFLVDQMMLPNQLEPYLFV